MRWLNEVLRRTGLLLVIAFMIASMAGLVMVDTPFNAPFYWAWRWLSAPLLLGGWLYALSQRRYFVDCLRVSPGSFLFHTIFWPPFLLLFSAGVACLVNASFPTGRLVRFEGPVTRLNVHGGKSHSYVVTLQDENTCREVRLTTAASTYRDLEARLREGWKPRFQREMNIGLLGIPFRWR